MGRRKIEIKAIKDDRNRSVTFLKRKGGLFKKAHELSVLCSVDVAVIIFGHNRKLYEFSSGDINDTIGRYQYVMQYGGAHEHKGPEDFIKKEGDEDEDEDEDGAPPRDSHTPPEQHGLMPHHMAHTQVFQHVRHVTPSASPPIPNGFQHRGPSPQPGHLLSRPNSRIGQHPGHVRRLSSNLAPPQPYPSQAPQPQPSYAYMPNPPFYNPQAAQRPPPQGPPGTQYGYTHPMPQHPQVQQYMQQEQRRQSMPPAPQMQPSPRMQPTAQMQPHPQQQQQQQQQQQIQHQQHQQAQQQSQQHQQLQPPPPRPQSQQQQERPPQPTISVPTPPPPQQHDFQSPPLPQPKPLHASAKHSIFTPIDDSQSMLAAHWGSSTPRSDVQVIKQEHRSQSIDVAAIPRLQPNGNSPSLQPPKISSTQPPTQAPQRTQSTSSVPPSVPPKRTNSMQLDKNKPKLRVQIPSEQSDGGSATADSSPKDSISGATPARSTDASHSSGVVLPPPSPSANSLRSAGATGPPNPFARPPPPTNSNSYGSSNRDMETPLSALPSRFVENGLLPSPSSFYPEWGFGRDSNMLPSPLTFQTPVVNNGPSFARDDSADRKRKTSDGGSDTSQKRVKT